MGDFVSASSQSWVDRIYEIWNGYRPIIGAPKFVLDIQYVAAFRDQSASKAKFSTIDPFLCKN